MVAHHEHNTAAISEFHREKRSQRQQIFTLLFLGWLLWLMILQIHHPLDTGVISSFGDLNVVWARFSERALAPFTNPGTFDFGIDSLGWIIGSTATILVALVFSGRNPLGMANESQVMALDELLELLTLLVGISAAATMWMALHNVVFLSSDPDSGPKFFLGMLCLMLVIFSVVRQRDAAVQHEIDAFRLTTSMRLHMHRWERMWGVPVHNIIAVQPRKIVRLVFLWAGSGFVFTLVSLILNSTFTPARIAASALLLTVIAAGAATLTALAVSLYRSSPRPGVGLGYALVLLVLVGMVVVVPFAAAAWQNEQAFLSLLSYFLWLGPSLLLIFRKPEATHMTRLQHRMAARPKNRFTRTLIACFDGARESAYWTELLIEARRQKHYATKLERLKAEQAASAAEAAEAEAAEAGPAEAEAAETSPRLP